MSALAPAGDQERLQLGAHTLPYRAYPFERALEGIARAGFRYVGIWNDHAGGQVVPPEAGTGEIARVRRLIEQHGLRPRMSFRFPSATADPAAQLRRTIEVAAALGVPFVLLSGPSQ